MKPNQPVNEFSVLEHTNYRMLVREPYQHELDAIEREAAGIEIIEPSVKVVRDTVSGNDYILYGAIEHDAINTSAQIESNQSNAWGKFNFHQIENGELVKRLDEVANDLSMREALGNTWRINTNTDQKQEFIDTAITLASDQRLGVSVSNEAYLSRFAQQELERERAPLDKRAMMNRHHKLEEGLEQTRERLNNNVSDVVTSIVNNDPSMSRDELESTVEKQVKNIQVLGNSLMKANLMPETSMVANDGSMWDAPGAARFTNNKFAALEGNNEMLLRDVEERFLVSKTHEGDRQVVNSRLTQDEDIQKIITISNKENENKTYAFIVKDGNNALWMRAVTVDQSFRTIKEDAESFKELGINPATLTQGVVATTNTDNILKSQEPHVQDMLKQVSPNSLRVMISKAQIADQALASGKPDPKPLMKGIHGLGHALVDESWDITELNEQQMEAFNTYHSDPTLGLGETDVVYKAFLIESAQGTKTLYSISARTSDDGSKPPTMVESHESFNRDGNPISEDSPQKDWVASSLSLKDSPNVDADSIRNTMAAIAEQQSSFDLSKHPRLATPFGKDNPHPAIEIEAPSKQVDASISPAARRPGRP